MRKKIMKVMSVMLAVVLIFTAAPLSGFVGFELPDWLDFSIKSSAATSGTCGENVYWTFDESTGTLTISGSDAMDNYTGFNRPWEDYEDSIEIAVINNGVTTIGYGAFADCDSLTSVTIPDSVTTIGDSAFEDCIGLTSITIPDSVTTIGDGAFFNCDNLTSVTIPNSVTTIGDYAFYSCDSIRNITIPDSVTTIGDGAFVHCTSLTSITVDNNQYYSSDEYGVLFNKDKTILIHYPKGNDRTTYTVPDSVTTIGVCAFYYCVSLESVTIPDSVTTIGVYAFYSCNSIRNITIPDSVTTIGDAAFDGCTSLADIYYSGSEEQWNEISIGLYNECLTNATIHDNSTGKKSSIIADCEVGDIIEFGSYPQSEITDETLLTKLNSLPQTWNSYGYYTGIGDWDDGQMKPSDYMKYADVIYNGSKYRAVTFLKYRPYNTGFISSIDNTHQDDNGYYTNTTYWFEYEPLEWRVLEPDEGLIVCESIIDSQPYNSTIYYNNADGEYYRDTSYTNYANDYATSSIREWLNNDFYNTSFTGEEKVEIQKSSLETIENNIIYDNVFLLNYRESTNPDYGFNSSTTRISKATEYAKCNGLCAYDGNSCWWQRYSGGLSYYGAGVDTYGYLSNDYLVNDLYGVRPALKLIYDSSTSNDDFVKETYIADIWTDSSEVTNELINMYLYDIDDLSNVTTKLLNDDKDFVDSLKGWEIANIINDPTKISDDLVNKKQYYQSIIFSLLSSILEEGNISNYVVSINASDTYKFSKALTKFVNSIEGIDANHILTTQSLTESEKALLTNELKNSATSELIEGFKSVDVIVDFLKYASNISNFINTCSNYKSLLNIDESIENLLKTMYQLCDSCPLSASDSLCLKAALEETINACNSKLGVMFDSVCDGTLLISGWTADMLCGEIWNVLRTSNVYLNVLNRGLVVGMSISNLAFSTDATIDKYYALCCLNDVRDLIKLSVINCDKEYKSSRTKDNAKTYIASVELLFSSYLLSCGYTVDYYEVALEDSLVSQILPKYHKTFESFKEVSESIKENTLFTFKGIQRLWCYNLIEDYPELFDTIAEEIDIAWYSNLEHANLRVEGISFEYTGEAVTPNVIVIMNNERLTLNEDYEVSYSNNTETGVATVTVTGIGDYWHGSNSTTFTITEPFYKKKVDIRNNGPVDGMITRSTKTVTDTYSNNLDSSINIYVYDGTKEIAVIKNNQIIKSEIQVVIWNNRVSLLLPDKDYKIVVESNGDTSIDYSYSEYNNDLEITNTTNYNNATLSPGVVMIQTLQTGEVKFDNVIDEPEFSIQSPSRTEIRNKDGIILHANIEGTAPVGSHVRWESSNGNFDKSGDGSNLKVIAKNKGWTTFTAILCDADGNELARDSVEMYSKSGFFDKIGGFFRGLFGMTKIYEN